MGEIADGIIEGSICAICCSPFLSKNDQREVPDENGMIMIEGYKHGYPVACTYCWDSECGYPKQDKKCKT